MKDKKIYAIYKGEKFIDVGTRYELAERLGVKPYTIYFYTTNSYKRRNKKENSKRIEIYVIDEE